MESEFQFHYEGAVVGAAPTVTKALDVLDLLGGAEQGLRLKDIATRLGLPESTTHRLLTSLAARGYVQQREDYGLYQLGWKIVVLADALGSGARLVETMRPYLQRLVREVGQTINLAVLSNDQVMYLDCQTPNNSLALYVAPGLTLPIYATSLGKVLLAHLPPDELDSVLARIPFTPLTPNTISAPTTFREVLAAVRANGYALDLGELRPDVNCLAVPILDSTGRARAAVSMTAPSAELPADWRESFPPRLMAVAGEASARCFGARALVASVA